MTATVIRKQDVPWTVAQNRDATAEMTKGVETRTLSEGDGGLYVKEARFAPGKVVTPHSHTVDEFLFLLDGSCTLDDGTELSAGDSVILLKNHAYGFEVGPKGMRFLNIRPGDARLTVAE